MTHPLALGPVLDLIERWHEQQRTGYPLHMPKAPIVSNPTADAWCSCPACELTRVPVSALKALAEQHAAQLRSVAAFGFDYRTKFDHTSRSYSAELKEVADFLCVPRRELEAE